MPRLSNPNVNLGQPLMASLPTQFRPQTTGANTLGANTPISNPGGIPDFNFNLSGRPSGKNQLKGFRTGLGSAQLTNRTLPGLLNTYFQGLGQTSPLLGQSQLDIFKNFGPQFAQTQAEIDRIGRAGTAQTDLDIARTIGRDLTGELASQDRMVNPEFYQGREAFLGKGLDLLGGMDPNKLTESEIANVERTANRSNIGRGVASSGSNTAGIQNALMFDDRLQNKRNQLNNVLTSFGNTLPGLRADFNTLFATGKQNVNQDALNAILPTQQLGLAQNIDKNVQGVYGPAYEANKEAQIGRRRVADTIFAGADAVPDY